MTQALKGEELHYIKTQYTNSNDDTIDSPGEYAESKRFSVGLACFSFEADVVAIVQAADEPFNLFGASCRSFILRPLIGMDKSEIVEISRKIDTYELSILPYEDCCTVFTPKHPKTRPSVAEVTAAQEDFDFAPLIQEAIEGTEVKMIRPSY